MPSWRTVPSGFEISIRFTGCGRYLPLSSCARIAGQCCFRNSCNSSTVIPFTPALPLLALIRDNARLQLTRSQTSSIICSPMAVLHVPPFAASDSVLSPRPFTASPLSSSAKANTGWLFRRLSLMGRAAYVLLPFTPCRDRSGLQHIPAYFALCPLWLRARGALRCP